MNAIVLLLALGSLLGSGEASKLMGSSECPIGFRSMPAERAGEEADYSLAGASGGARATMAKQGCWLLRLSESPAQTLSRITGRHGCLPRTCPGRRRHFVPVGSGRLPMRTGLGSKKTQARDRKAALAQDGFGLYSSTSRRRQAERAKSSTLYGGSPAFQLDSDLVRLTLD